MRTLLVTLNAKYIHSSLALRYLKYYIREKAGFNADILEFSINNNILEMLQDIYSYKPEIIGFACYIWNIEMTRQLISLIKSVMPEVKIICGGPEVSYEPESLMMIDKNIDYIISGEGEKPFLSLLTKIYNNDKLSLEPGIVFIDDAKVVNGGIYTLDNLNELIFPYNEEEISSSKDKIIYYESSRGCPFSCQYCLSSAIAATFTAPDAAVIVEPFRYTAEFSPATSVPSEARPAFPVYSSEPPFILPSV